MQQSDWKWCGNPATDYSDYNTDDYVRCAAEETDLDTTDTTDKPAEDSGKDAANNTGLFIFLFIAPNETSQKR